MVQHLFGASLWDEAMQQAMDKKLDADIDEYDYICKRLAEIYKFHYERNKR